MEEKNDIKIVKGDGTNLNISPVKEGLNVKPKTVKPKEKKIIIPKKNNK